MKRNASYQPLEAVVAKAAVAEGDSVAEGVAEAEAEVVATWEANPVEKVSKETLLLDPMDQKIGQP